MYANLRCSLVTSTLFGLGSLFPNAPESIGLWCYEANNGTFYDIRDITGGELFQAIRAIGLVAILTGLIVFVLYTVACCVHMPNVYFFGVGILALVTCIFQGLVLLIFQSDLCAYGCSLDTGGKCAVAATVFWFLAVVSICLAVLDAPKE